MVVRGFRGSQTVVTTAQIRLSRNMWAATTGWLRKITKEGRRFPGAQGTCGRNHGCCSFFGSWCLRRIGTCAPGCCRGECRQSHPRSRRFNGALLLSSRSSYLTTRGSLNLCHGVDDGWRDNTQVRERSVKETDMNWNGTVCTVLGKIAHQVKWVWWHHLLDSVDVFGSGHLAEWRTKWRDRTLVQWDIGVTIFRSHRCPVRHDFDQDVV